MRLLSGAVVLLSVVAINITVVAQPTQDLRKASFAWLPESIGISNKPPDTECLSVRLFDGGDFGVINKVGDRNLHNEILSGSERSASYPLCRNGEIKVTLEWNWHYCGCCLEPKIVSRRAAGIDDEWSRLKYGGADHNCDIGAQLANGGAFGVPNKPARFANAIFSGVRALSQGRDLLGYLLELSCSVKIRSLGFRFNMGEVSAPRLDRDLWWPARDRWSI
jgi:hypothetical protein